MPTTQRELDLAEVWRRTHRDYKGKLADGRKSLLVNRGGEGTCLVALEDLTDAEIADRLKGRRKEGK